MPCTFKHLSPDELPALLDLCSAALPLDTFSWRLLERRIFEDPRYREDCALGVEIDGRLAAATVGVLRAMPEGHENGWIKLLAVHPSHRRQGLATALLAEIEQRFRAAGARQLDTVGAPHYLWPGVDVRYTPACLLFQRAGFAEHRYTVNMAVDLAAQTFDTATEEHELVRAGYTIHRADHAGLPALQNFIRKEWAAWCDEVAITLGNNPVSMFYATRENVPVAFAAYDTSMFSGTFGPMGTDASCRGKGVGAVLLKKCLRDMKDLGYPRCEIAWVGPVGFYARQVGAHICRVFRDYRKPLT